EGLPSYWRRSVRYPNNWTPAVAAAAASAPVARIFLGFARFPAARAVTDPAGVTTVRWTDVRFTQGVLTVDQPTRAVNAFNVVIRIAPDGRVLQEQLGVLPDSRSYRR